MSASGGHVFVDRAQPGAVPEDRFKKKERLLFMVGRLNDKDMQITAARELREAAQVMFGSYTSARTSVMRYSPNAFLTG